jgi:hypothetical protein
MNPEEHAAGGAKRARSHFSLGTIQYVGGTSWKKYQGSDGHFRSYPGNPLRERSRASDQPFSELTVAQRQAARNVLGIVDEDTWEKAMPRRCCGVSHWTVVTFQAVTWEDLSADQQHEASTALGLSKEMWNGKLALFHDKLWTVEGLTMSSKEFSPVLSTVQKMAGRQAFTERGDLVRFLLDLGRLLTPSQGLAICETIKAAGAFEALAGIDSQQKLNIHVLVASFLSDPKRFLDPNPYQLLPFWDDENTVCAFGNLNLYYATAGKQPQPYHRALQQRHCRQLALRRCVSAVLTGSYYSGGGSNGNALPILPRSLALRILNDWIGSEEPVDPWKVQWLVYYGHVTVADYLSKDY